MTAGDLSKPGPHDDSRLVRRARADFRQPFRLLISWRDKRNANLCSITGHGAQRFSATASWQVVERLLECDPEAEVRIMSQEGWPFENAIRGVVTREEVGGDEECECDHRLTEPHEEDCPAGGEPQYPDGTEARDVFIVEGAQERYGSKAAWNLV